MTLKTIPAEYFYQCNTCGKTVQKRDRNPENKIEELLRTMSEAAIQ